MVRKPVTMWVVRAGDDLDVRSVNGRESFWCRGAQAPHDAHVRAGGVGKDVLLVETDDVNDELDTAYRAKYHHYPESIVGSVVSPKARAATLKLVPRRTGGQACRSRETRSRPRPDRATGSPARCTSTRSQHRRPPRV
jgi:hypothetical protein